MKSKLLNGLFFAALLIAAPAQFLNAKGSVIVGTYNVRVDVASDAKKGDGWKSRVPKICDIVKFYGFDIFGGQEVTRGQLNDMLELLPGYSYVGVGREDGVEKGEYSPVFYRSDRFTLLESGNFWLAPDWTKPVFGWDAACIRICSWGKFRDKESGKVFWFFNTHFDHMGVVARKESAKLILARIAGITNNSPDVIFTGDLNTDQHSEAYSTLAGAGTLADAFETAKIRFAWGGTFTGFDPEVYNDKRIDHIFTGKSFTVKRYGILYDAFRSVDPAGDGSDVKKVRVRIPSDHYPVMAELTF